MSGLQHPLKEVENAGKTISQIIYFLSGIA